MILFGICAVLCSPWIAAGVAGTEAWRTDDAGIERAAPFGGGVVRSGHPRFEQTVEGVERIGRGSWQHLHGSEEGQAPFPIRVRPPRFDLFTSTRSSVGGGAPRVAPVRALAAVLPEEPVGAESGSGSGSKEAGTKEAGTAADATYPREAAPWHFIFRAAPLTSHVSTRSKGFRAVEPSGESGRVKRAFWSLPTLGFGAGRTTEQWQFDATTSLGVLYQFHSDGIVAAPLGRLVGTVRYRFTSRLAIGVRVGGIASLEPRWTGDGDVDFDPARGWLAGLALAFGTHEAALTIDVDYTHLEFDVDPKPSVSTNERTLDASGITIQLGAICRF